MALEQRAEFTANDRVLQLKCRAGAQPAGLLLDSGDKTLPSSFNLNMAISYSSQAAFALGIADNNRFDKGNPVIFSLAADETSQTLAIPYAQLDAGQSIHWSLVCPQQQAEINIHSFQLLPAIETDRITQRDLWIWKPASWRNESDRLIALLKKYQANRVFISVEMDESKGKVLHSQALGEFVSRARQNAIAVWAVEGDPHATLPQGQAQFVNRANILRQYNQQVAKHSRLAGVQYDIEPYLVKGWSLDQAQWFNAYIETIEQINQVLNLPIEIAIPFWWQFKSVNNGSLLDAVAPHIDSVNVMNYRTDAVLIKTFAQPFLEWGVRAGKKVSIALEAGPIPDEQRWHFHHSNSGHLWLVRDFSTPALLLLNTDKTSTKAETFTLNREGVLTGDVVSFHKDPARLIEMLPQLESLWQQWPSFAGISLHGFEDELY